MKTLALGLTLTAALAFSTAPLAAQAVDPHQPNNNGSAADSATVPPGDVAPGVDPGTAAANADIRGNIAATAAANANIAAQHEADMAAYDAAVRAHGRQTAHYARQQRAYADAMAAWRVQVAACQQGHQVACNSPAPDPSNFY